jgi:hypothetical protein
VPTLDQRYERDASLVSTEIAAGLLLVPIRDHVRDLDDVYTLNETAARIWALVDGRRSLRDIRDCLVAEFDVGPEEALRDVTEFVSQLEAAGALRRC